MKEATQERKLVQVALFPTLGGVIEAFLHVFQGIAVWTTVTQFPMAYKLALAKFAEFWALDFTSTFALDTLVTPVLQFAVGLVVVLCTIYVAVVDDRRFLFNIAKFTRLRDREDAEDDEERAAIKARALGFETLLSTPPEVVVLAQLFAPIDRLRVHRFVNKLDKNDEPLDVSVESATLLVRLSDQRKAELVRCPSGEVLVRVTHDVSGAAIPHSAQQRFPLRTISGRCPEHGRLLCESIQNDVYPYVNRRTCCAVEGAEPCNRNVGAMYCCDKTHVSAKDGTIHSCNFALCARHYNPTLLDLMQSYMASPWRGGERHGRMYLVGRAIVLLLIVLYTPLIRTALMTLSCHPFFACAFGSCWSVLSPEFTIAAYCAIITLVVVGVGAPMFCIFALLRRYWYMRLAFRRNDLESPYVDDTGDINVLQWVRFLTSDDSAISAMYNNLLPNRMGYVPLQLLFKLFLLLPAILIEPNTSNQLVGISCVEIAFALFTLLSSPYISPWSDMLVRLGSAHQLVILGFGAFFAIEGVEGKTVGVDSGTFMIAFSSLYIILMATMVFAVLLKPVLEVRWRHFMHRRNLQRCGIPPVSLAPMYLGNVGGDEILRGAPTITKAAEVDDEDVARMQVRALKNFKRVAVALISSLRMSQTLKAISNSASFGKPAASAAFEPAAAAGPRVEPPQPHPDEESDEEAGRRREMDSDPTAALKTGFSRRGSLAVGSLWGAARRGTQRKRPKKTAAELKTKIATLGNSDSDDSSSAANSSSSLDEEGMRADGSFTAAVGATQRPLPNRLGNVDVAAGSLRFRAFDSPKHRGTGAAAQVVDALELSGMRAVAREESDASGSDADAVIEVSNPLAPRVEVPE